jgi:hypothetical protein
MRKMTNDNGGGHSNDIQSLLPDIPGELRDALIKHFRNARERLMVGDYSASEIEAAKVCEAVVRVLEWHVNTDKSYTPLGASLPSMPPSWLNRMEGATADESVRFHIPRLIFFVLGVRNKRGVGHLPGKIDTNHIDAMILERAITWIVAELIRLHHRVPIAHAQAMVDAMIEQHVPVIWTNGSMRKILRTDLSYKDKVLVLLFHSSRHICHFDKLFEESGYSRKDVFKSRVIGQLDAEALIHFDRKSGDVHLTQTGVRYVESNRLYEMPS